MEKKRGNGAIDWSGIKAVQMALVETICDLERERQANINLLEALKPFASSTPPNTDVIVGQWFVDAKAVYEKYKHIEGQEDTTGPANPPDDLNANKVGP